MTAAVATRLMPVLARDARRLADAQRTLTGGARRGVARAARGDRGRAGPRDRRRRDARGARLRAGGRPPRRRRPWSRHDLAFAASALALAALGVAAGLGGWGRFEAYPRPRAALGARRSRSPPRWPSCVLLPFADRRGIGVSVLALERRHLRLSGRGRRRAARRVADRRAGRVRRRRRRLGLGQVDAAARRLRAGAALPRRRRSPAGCAAAGSTRASTARASSPRSPARCSRTPRRRW